MPPGGSHLSLIERFMQFSFYQHALVAGLAIGVCCALLSVFVVHRRMAFIGEGITHAAFGGVGTALLLELAWPWFGHPLWRYAVVAIFCIAAGIFMGRIGRQRRIGEDAAIGIVLAIAMAIGVILIDVRTDWLQRQAAAGLSRGLAASYAPSFHDILFGNILSVSRAETWAAVAVAAAVSGWVALTFRGLIFYTVDEEAATTFGVATGYLHYGLVTALALTIVVAMRLLGVILVSALLIMPGVVAGFWSRRIRGVMIAALVTTALGIIGGILLAMEIQVLSTGPVIVLALGTILLASWVVRRKS